MKSKYGKYPFDFNKGVYKSKLKVSKKLAKALIVKFLKREHIFKEMVTECMLWDNSLKTVDDVLDRMVQGNPYLMQCLYYSERTFVWSQAKIYHKENLDAFWNRLKDKWACAIDVHGSEEFRSNSIMVDRD